MLDYSYSVTKSPVFRIIICKKQRKYMKLSQSLQFIPSTFQVVSNGLFACGVLNDYRTDWALVNDFDQLEKNVNSTKRNLG